VSRHSFTIDQPPVYEGEYQVGGDTIAWNQRLIRRVLGIRLPAADIEVSIPWDFDVVMA